MKLRMRFKKALFSFFQEEILKSVEPIIDNERKILINKDNIKFTKFTRNVKLFRDSSFTLEPFEISLEKQIQDAKHKLFNDIRNYIIVESKDNFDSFKPFKRVIAISLYVGIKN